MPRGDGTGPDGRGPRGLGQNQRAMRNWRREQGACGGTPRVDGSGGGRGNRGTLRQPPSN